VATKREFIDPVRGTVIERIVIVTDSDALELDIRFQDKHFFRSSA
jgi:hypothetical protein